MNSLPLLLAGHGSVTRLTDNSLTPASDGAALVMVALVCFLLGCFAMAAVVLYRRSQRAPSQESRLIEEVSGEPRVGGDSKGDEPWERSGDWWKTS